MADVLNSRQRSYCMSQIKGKNTKPEVQLRKALWGLGFRYRLESSGKVFGKPDIVLPSRRTVVFVDGCFWHKCPKHFQAPKTNAGFWMEKIEKNLIRDKKVNQELKMQGWKVIRIWEHDVKKDPLATALKISQKIL